MYPFYFSCSLLGPRSLGMTMSVLHFLYLTWPYPWNVCNVWFTFLLYVIALCMMYVYLYLLVYRWLCTLYDGLSWLREWPSLVMRAFDLVVWVCAQGDCRRCISCYIVFMIIAVWLSRSMSPSDTGFPVYATCINTLDTLGGLRLVSV